MLVIFSQNSELFSGNEAIITIRCKHLPDMYKQPHRCTTEQAEVLKKNIELHALKEIVSRMAKQRYENLTYSNKLREDHLTAYNEIKHCLNHYQLHLNEILITIFNNRIIPALEVLKPHPDSRFFSNYNDKLIDVVNHVETLKKQSKN